MTRPDPLRDTGVAAAQRGAALVVGLLLLLVLTILAISGMTTATLELRMVGNYQYEERAFQSAETGVERAIVGGIYNTNVPTVVAEAPVAEGSEDTVEYTVTFDEERGVTSVPGGGYSLGTGFEAYHFVVDSTGRSNRDAVSEHQQSFYIVGPGSN